MNTVYICVELETEELDDRTLLALRELGVSGIEQGEPYHAYGLVDDLPYAQAVLTGCRLIKGFELRDPPSGM